MLRPTKHSHPDKTVINIAFVLLSYLKKMRVADFARLRELARRANRGGDVLLLPALNLLYLLGLLEYHPKNDSFEYLGQQ